MPAGGMGAPGAAAPAKIAVSLYFNRLCRKKQGKSRTKTGQNQGESRRGAGGFGPRNHLPAGRGVHAAPPRSDSSRRGEEAAAATNSSLQVQSKIAEDQLNRKLHSGRRRTLRGRLPQGFGRVRIVDREWTMTQTTRNVERKIHRAPGRPGRAAATRRKAFGRGIMRPTPGRRREWRRG